MLSYYIELALRSLRRHKAITALMIVAIGLGIGASMTMLTLLHVISADPLPRASSGLFYPQIEPRDRDARGADGRLPDQLTWTDAMNLLQARRGSMQAAMAGGQLAVYPQGIGTHAFFADARYTTSDFFAMFHTPMLHGQAWSRDDDDRGSRVVVLGRALADRLFGADQAVGRSIRLSKETFRVVGVLDRWEPVPLFYDLTRGGYAKTESIFMPLSTATTLRMPFSGAVTCWGKEGFAFEELTRAARCVWLQFWVKLDSPADVAAYHDFLVHYSQEQKALGRFSLPADVRLHDVPHWLDTNHVVPGGVELQALLAFGFLLVCLVNTVALLLVKFSRRMGELSVRRAMGAARRDIFAQLMTEAAAVGISGGVLGLALAMAGLWLVRQQPSDYAKYARMDSQMLLACFALAIVAALAAAAFPALRTCRVAPARALKVQ